MPSSAVSMRINSLPSSSAAKALVLASRVKRESAYPGSIRIIGGSWRSRKLRIPESQGLRPTPNRVRETVFNWLQPWLPGAHCLDVTAGTGILCLEALSRGAASAVMVEQSATAVQALRANVQSLGATQARVVHGDAIAFLQGEVQSQDIVFLDPPFRSDLIERCAALMEQRGWIKTGGLIYIEAPSEMTTLPLPSSWEILRSKTSGQVGYHLAQYQPKPSDNANS